MANKLSHLGERHHDDQVFHIFAENCTTQTDAALLCVLVWTFILKVLWCSSCPALCCVACVTMFILPYITQLTCRMLWLLSSYRLHLLMLQESHTYVPFSGTNTSTEHRYWVSLFLHSHLLLSCITQNFGCLFAAHFVLALFGLLCSEDTQPVAVSPSISVTREE